MKKRTTSTRRLKNLFTLAVAATALTVAIVAAPAQAALKHRDGTVAARNADARTFRITTQGGSVIRFKVNSRTVFERIAGGFSGLRRGLAIEVDFVQTANGNIARQVEPQGGNGGGGGGGHGGGNDDGPNHT